MPWKPPGKVRARTYGTKSPRQSKALRFIDSAKSPSTVGSSPDFSRFGFFHGMVPLGLCPENFFPSSKFHTSSDFTKAFMKLSCMICRHHVFGFCTKTCSLLLFVLLVLPVMLLGMLLAHKRYSLVKYLCVVLIVVGVMIFMFPDVRQMLSAVLAWLFTIAMPCQV